MSNMTSKGKFVKNWFCLLLVGTLNLAAPEKPADRTLPVRGFCVASPSGNRVDEFIKFIEEELASRSVNVLILRVDYSFQFLSLPEMADKGGLSWKNPEAATAQVKDMVRFRESSTPQMKQHFQGVVQTIWSGSGGFLDQYYGRKPVNDQKNPGHTESKCFLRMFEEIANIR